MQLRPRGESPLFPLDRRQGGSRKSGRGPACSVVTLTVHCDSAAKCRKLHFARWEATPGAGWCSSSFHCRIVKTRTVDFLSHLFIVFRSSLCIEAF